MSTGTDAIGGLNRYVTANGSNTSVNGVLLDTDQILLAYTAKQGEFKEEDPVASPANAQFPDKPLVDFNRRWFDKQPSADGVLAASAQRGRFTEEKTPPPPSAAVQFPAQPQVPFSQQWFKQGAGAPNASQ
ncbi:hypothetical protein AAVH_01189 [Aphelenchoides avenae]|nr:hypothetical protein AAVH_01189 [Aphelenchus avenae]